MSIDALMALLQRSGGVRTDFVETRTISILAAPIETRGTLYFDPPDRIARVTTRPGRSTAVVRGTRAEVADETGKRSVDLRSSDVAYSLISNIMVLLRGDLSALRERYEIGFAADGEAWQLDLQPRASDLRAIIERVRVKGVGATVSEMVTLETNGDATHAAFSNVETGVDFEADANRGVFAIDPPPQANE
jgi:outer membrane lipoprotein-sorting protein